MAATHDISELPAVLYDADLCALLEISLRTLKRHRRLNIFPISELPRLDRRHRYSRRDVEAFLNREPARRRA
jgi:hypothetical protein